MSKWKQRKGKHIASAPTLPGVWMVKEGGWLVRGRATNPKTSKSQSIQRVIQAPTAEDALVWLRERQAEIRAGGASAPQVRKRFSEFATSLFAAKVEADELSSAASVQKWSTALTHHLIPDLGDLWMDMVTRSDLEAWRLDCARRVSKKQIAPTTVNTHLSILRVIMKAATSNLDLVRDPADGLKPLPTRNHHTYTAESPNSLPIEVVPVFLSKMKELYPQFYAMTLLGITTGLRPSHMRPIRHRGKTPDVHWDARYLMVRRSQTLGDVVMNSTKTGVEQRLAVPDTLLEVFHWHLEKLRPKQETSDLLFPSVRGGFRARSCLDKPFAEVAEAIELGYRFTPRGMRRTYQDLGRATQVADLVIRSISGHATEAMQDHYSTVSDEEQRSAMAQIIDLAEARQRFAES